MASAAISAAKHQRIARMASSAAASKRRGGDHRRYWQLKQA